MHYKNDGSDAVNALQNQFTAYLTMAVRRARSQYVRSKIRRFQMELAMEEIGYLSISVTDETDKLADVEALLMAMKAISERERYVLLARVIDGKDFGAIAADLGMSYKGAASVYYRTIVKLRRMLGGEQNEF